MISRLSTLWGRAAYTYRQIRDNPLTEQSVGSAVNRWLRWQIGSRLVPGPVVVPLTAHARLLVSPGMHGATLGIFTGLADFEEMGFLLHFLRPEDLFGDVGANVGVFGVLAGAVVGCRIALFEPGERAFCALQENLRLNGLESRAVTHQKAVSDRVGPVGFTNNLDTLNHVVTEGEEGLTLSATTLDTEFLREAPKLLKIDVEGFEASVLRGGTLLFQNPNLEAIIIELGDHSRRYGVDPNETFRTICGYGFEPVDYDPITRHLTRKPQRLDASKSDTIFVRSPEAAGERTRFAPRYRVLDREI